MDFPIDHLLDEDKAGQQLQHLLYPHGLFCPGCGGENYSRHSNLRPGVDKQRCKDCNHIFHFLSSTAFKKTQFSNSKLVMILRGFSKGESTAGLARELKIDRSNLHKLRHRFQQNATHNLDNSPLPDEVTETDEAYQNAGEKGIPHLDPDDPPRRRANKKRDLGTSQTIVQG